jgi:hypothetical protein
MRGLVSSTFLNLWLTVPVVFAAVRMKPKPPPPAEVGIGVWYCAVVVSCATLLRHAVSPCPIEPWYVQRKPVPMPSLAATQLVLSKHTAATCIALCTAISAQLNEARLSDSTRAAAKIDWLSVSARVRNPSSTLHTPLECQRLWKYIGALSSMCLLVIRLCVHGRKGWHMCRRCAYPAYQVDVGELAVLAPDTDDDEPTGQRTAGDVGMGEDSDDAMEPPAKRTSTDE